MNQPLPSANERRIEGILLVDKPEGKNSFSLVSRLRKLLNVKTIGHAGTLDPFATGVMVMLIGKPYTRLSDKFLGANKEYIATLFLGIETDSHDKDGQQTADNDYIPKQDEVEAVIKHFQGELEQVPPMFSAKKQKGVKLYDLARKGITVERPPVKVVMETEILSYAYPYLKIRVKCSKGTYVRTIAHDMGRMLKCGAHLSALQRTRSGDFSLEQCIDGKHLFDIEYPLENIIKYISKEVPPHG